MKDPKIVAAYDRAAPDEAAKARMLRRILEKKEAAETAEAPKKRRTALRILLPIAAAVAMLAALAVSGSAAYRKWRLPAPESYTPDPEHGIVSVHATSTYDAPPAEGETVPPLSDEDFLRKTVDFLRTAGFPEAEPRDLTVSRQKNLYWDREEVEVRFDREGVRTSVRFDAESGYLLGFSGIDLVLDGTAACTTQAEADALARRYYEALPVARGYILAGCEKYDDQYWSYNFCREVEPGLVNEYEMVRISINPVSGQLVGCTVFYVPLLDDHEPGDAPLTQDQAEAIARERLSASMENGFTLKSAEKRICAPNWYFTDTPAVHAKASDVTRLCWELIYEKPVGDPELEFESAVVIMIDLYTGEILGGDVMK